MTNNLVRENNGRETSRSERFITPPASVSENGDGYLLELEMPGVNKDGLEISIEKNELSIVGRRSNPAIDGTLVHRESRRIIIAAPSRSTPRSTAGRSMPGSTKALSPSPSRRRRR
jgi:HSP20 family protein